MSIIGVSKINAKCTLQQMVNPLAKALKKKFEVLAFGAQNKLGFKVCFIRILDKQLDPQQAVDIIKRITKFNAFVPKTIPDLPAKGIRPKKTQYGKHALPTVTPDMVLVSTHSEILRELQSKYMGLYNLSNKTGHKLLDDIARIIFDRLKTIMESNPDSLHSGFTLSKCYRRLHPHFGDFQLILSTLHRLQDAAGVPRAQILESTLAAVSAQPYVIDKIPYNQVQQACNKYSERIVNKVTDHIRSLKTDMTDNDTEEDIARKRVREELKKISQYLPLMVKQVISNHFVPQRAPYQRIRIYGEPFLPTKDQMVPFVRRYRPIAAAYGYRGRPKGVGIMRSDRMYNLLQFNVPLAQYASLLAMDGTVIGGARLVIRPSDIPLYKVPGSLVTEMRAVFGVDPTDEVETAEVEDHEMSVENEDWAEDIVE